ncbi:16S rRNA (guanine(966)-N(2))-methyltransferase RsmD [Sedimentibacter sp. zth1]|uniref:16S rRNA (guanine(966)-N(2))-methyltransferase RsmD n=1 Tax=Sedimentibacter sp. zth1 TaxID=2816908 RepID=UPI001A91F205|nr:16S rRNA (guanine(966)-N(2))-methyltransferase RsmD [Sedimentibacter sp. zth1]QSX06611.1 16S rRNA (guanine(966)-N(2))-methyltransferase RsmD [Sedimentibacter sp. zth1]
MRVISGNNKGKKLFAPKDMSVRPTSDKIKEAIFNMLGYIDEDSVVLDLFAGTGNVGIEFLCRGAKQCHFTDISHKSISFVKKNIALCKLEDKSMVYINDYEKAINYFTRCNVKFDYIFADAPYHLNCAQKVIDLVLNNEILNKNGTLIIECEKTEKMFEYGIPSVLEYKEKIYGITKIGIIKFSEE